jgi:hypothetical protein
MVCVFEPAMTVRLVFLEDVFVFLSIVRVTVVVPDPELGEQLAHPSPPVIRPGLIG